MYYLVDMKANVFLKQWTFFKAEMIVNCFCHLFSIRSWRNPWTRLTHGYWRWRSYVDYSVRTCLPVMSLTFHSLFLIGRGSMQMWKVSGVFKRFDNTSRCAFLFFLLEEFEWATLNLLPDVSWLLTAAVLFSLQPIEDVLQHWLWASFRHVDRYVKLYISV